ncbi:hypothetical protein [Pseudomonas phage COT4]|uniref:Uncharacterized protein n=1 Tax=Pseudomonas phage M5.1 TaxID=2873460 RepID=A0AAE8XFN5_9CAUD|nr:hypothetical protein QGX13_gp161 [Pseudomonas phage M5.1]UAV89663.1 hypothetical protein M51_81 [Pseudomonas phage M5.1]UAV89930.1 hypothetical protein REC_81 [Pseudomonas phage REC]UGL61263.1 hypothetical protein [Pseudomonas phage COT4]UGL62657.1 hypothetical protein [Pseudomonas phage REC1]
MPYTNNPAGSATDRVRLNVGDIWPDMEWLHDEDYQYFIDKNNGNENRATLDAARALLFVLSRYTRERTGDIEVYGGDIFSNFYRALELILKDPNIAISVAMPYAGGIDRQDMHDNRANCNNNAVIIATERNHFRLGCGNWQSNYDALNCHSVGGGHGLQY